MIKTYIKNSGITKTVLQNNDENKTNEIKWDTDYDGNLANISLSLNKNGSHKDYNFSLDNEDLANMLNINSVNLPLHKRLKKDFKKQPVIYQIEFDNIEPSYLNPSINEVNESIHTPISIDRQLNYLPSPKQNEEFIVPVMINERPSKKFTLTPRKHHKKVKTHKTYKVYKHKISKPRSKTNSKRKTSLKYSLL
jgi:hypothetical protein